MALRRRDPSRHRIPFRARFKRDAHHARVVEVFRTANSFVDCLSFVVMKKLEIDEALAVNSDFTHRFTTRPGPLALLILLTFHRPPPQGWAVSGGPVPRSPCHTARILTSRSLET